LEAVFSQRLVPLTAGGRVAAYEVMLGSPAVKTAIREGRTHMLDNIIMTSGEYGMTTLEYVLARYVREGKISFETAQAFALRPGDIQRYVKGEAS
jgi:twitching motility protein PilT